MVAAGLLQCTASTEAVRPSFPHLRTTGYRTQALAIGETSAVAATSVAAAVLDIGAAATALATAAVKAAQQPQSGLVSSFASAQAAAFSQLGSLTRKAGAGARPREVESFTQAVAQAIQQGGQSTVEAYGYAFAQVSANACVIISRQVN